jgi:phosphate starvation-inducible protein PhoH and related proteins
MAKRSIRSKLSFVQFDEVDAKARQDGPIKKHWTVHDLNHIKPKTQAQHQMCDLWEQGQNIVAHGTAGSGKSFLAMYLCLRELFQHGSEYEKIIVVRSTVQTRNQGFLPGDETMKAEAFERPYKDIVDELVHYRNTYKHMKDAGKIEFASTSFIRGVSWNNCLIIVDEIQNENWQELNTVMTRVGTGSRVIVCGDIKQSDLVHNKNDVTGLPMFMRVVERHPSFSTVQFTRDDIVRSGFVKKWIIACEEEGV